MEVKKVADNDKNQRIANYIFCNEANEAIRTGNLNDNYPNDCTTEELKKDFCDALNLRDSLVASGNQITDEMRRRLDPNKIAILELALTQRVEGQKANEAES